jgi:hypothetical protein
LYLYSLVMMMIVSAFELWYWRVSIVWNSNISMMLLKLFTRANMKQ